MSTTSKTNSNAVLASITKFSRELDDLDERSQMRELFMAYQHEMQAYAGMAGFSHSMDSVIAEPTDAVVKARAEHQARGALVLSTKGMAKSMVNL